MDRQVIRGIANYKTKPYQKLSDSNVQQAISECVADFLAYLLIKRDIQLNHQVSRDPTRSSNQNMLYQNVSIFDMMRRFNLNSNLFNHYEVPKVLLPFSSFYTSTCSNRIKRGTFYRVLKEILSIDFRKKYHVLSFSSISGYLLSNHQIQLTPHDVEASLQEYQSFLSNRKEHL